MMLYSNFQYTVHHLSLLQLYVLLFYAPTEQGVPSTVGKIFVMLFSEQ
jgi:hypothetical protein